MSAGNTLYLKIGKNIVVTDRPVPFVHPLFIQWPNPQLVRGWR